MKLAVTWPSGGGPEVSRVVLKADDVSLDVVAYSFDSEMRELAMRLCRINGGLYKISLYRDPYGKGEIGEKLWESEQALARFDIVQLPIPSHTPVLIKVEKINSIVRSETLPDLAIDHWDATFDKGTITAKIHNLGNRSAENVMVSLFDGDTLIQEKTIDLIDAPIDFLPKMKEIIFENVAFTGNLNIKIDSRNQLKEIMKENNTAHVHKNNTIEVGVSSKK
jgi:hypothetical protein